MAITIRKTQETYEYVPLIERGEEKPFTVIIKRLPPRQFTILEDKMAKINQDESISFTTGTFNWAVIKKGIIDWRNMLDENGKEIYPLKNGKGELLDETLDLLPLDIITEIANTIVGISKDPDNANIYLGHFEDKTVPKNEEVEAKEPAKAKSAKAKGN
jgi:hypothetical protein